MSSTTIHFNTEYVIKQTQAPWVITAEENDQTRKDEIICFDPGRVKFSATKIEFRRWLEEDIIRPICGICNLMVWDLDSHLIVEHQVKVRG